MSFDVFLISSSQSPTGDEARAAVDRALAHCGARRGGPGECDIVDANGGEHEFMEGDDGMAGGLFPLRGLSPTIAALIFEVADATRCLIVPVQEDGGLLRTPSYVGAPPEDVDMPLVDIPDPAALLAFLEGGLEAWADYRNDITS